VVWVRTFDGWKEMEVAIGEVKESVNEVFVDQVGVDGLLEVRRGRVVILVVVGVVVGDDEFEQKFADLFGCWEGDFRSMFISLLPGSGETFAGVRVRGRASTLRRRSGADGRSAHGRWLLSRKTGVGRYVDNFDDLFGKLWHWKKR
jgi:hypothetical protein